MRRALLSILLCLCVFVEAQAQSLREQKAVETMIVDAVANINAGRPDYALKLLDRLYEVDPSNDAVSYYRGVCNYTLKKVEAAYENFSRAVELDPGNNWYKEALASTCAVLGKNSQMVQIYEELLEKEPQIYANAYNLTILGDKALAERKDSLAMSRYEQALSMQPDYPLAVLGQSEVYRLGQNFLDFFGAMNSFVRNPGVNSPAKIQYLENLFKYVDGPFYSVWHSQLDSLVDGSVKTAPTDSAALRFAGRWYYGTGRTDLGKQYLRSWVKEYPKSVDARMVQMELALYEKDFPAALNECDTLLSLTREDLEKRLLVLSIKGDCHHELGDEKAAFKAYEKALRLDPYYLPVLNNYAYYLCLSGNKLSKAEKMSRITVEKDPENDTYLDTYGWILHLLGRDADAKPYFKKAMIFGGKESDVILGHYATVLEALGETETAKYYRSLEAAKKK